MVEFHGKIHPLVVGPRLALSPSTDPALIQLLDAMRYQLVAMIQINQHPGGILILIHRTVIGVAMNTHALRGGEFYFDFIHRQIHRIITCFGHFGTVTVSGAIGIWIEAR